MPELFVAWVDALVAAGREDDAATACAEALGSVPALGEVRAEIAERYAPLADAPGHPASCASIAWRAAPTAARLRRLAACGDDGAIAAEADSITDTTPPRLAAALLTHATSPSAPRWRARSADHRGSRRYRAGGADHASPMV